MCKALLNNENNKFSFAFVSSLKKQHITVDVDAGCYNNPCYHSHSNNYQIYVAVEGSRN